jgi:hypothetical protein
VSRSAVHQAIASYLSSKGADGTIPNLSDVFAYPPKLLPESDFFDVPGSLNGCIIHVHLASQRETRVALGGPTSGKKYRVYEVILNCIYLSDEPQTETTGANVDAFIDGLTTAIEADRNAGDAGVIFQWGEGGNLTNGGPDVEITAYYPRTRMGTQNNTQTYIECRVFASEVLTT